MDGEPNAKPSTFTEWRPSYLAGAGRKISQLNYIRPIHLPPPPTLQPVEFNTAS